MFRSHATGMRVGGAVFAVSPAWTIGRQTMGRLAKGKRPKVPDNRRCTGHVTSGPRKGKRCLKAAIKGGTVCDTHGASAPQVINAAKERIRQYVAEMVDPDRVLQEAARLAFSDLTTLFDEKDRLKPKHDWPAEMKGAVSSTKTRRVNLDAADGHTDIVTELKVWDKPKMIEVLAKHLGLFEEKLRLSGDLNVRWKGE